MLLDADDSQLVLLDYQQKLMPFIHDGAAVAANALRLAQVAKLLEVPVLGTEHNPAGLGETIAQLRPFVGRILRKMQFSAAEAVLASQRMPARAVPAGNARS